MSEADDRRQLQDLMLSYAAAVDDRDMARYRACFADDVEIVGFGEAIVKGADTWTASVESQLEAFSATQHLMSPQLATVSDDAASARTDVQALHVLKDGDGAMFTLWATYLTNFIRTADGWKIARHELVIRATQQTP
ncbi:MAG: nuclear transport factor 2 family protein [Luminiphilus sp.]|nr:nuclear transport factor 2 family protein [Luminiphilus sp.]